MLTNFKRIYVSSFFIFFLMIYHSQSLFSNTYRKCQLFKGKAKNIGQLKQQKVPIINEDYYIQPLVITKKKLQYKYVQYYYTSYIGAGGSGEVFLVEDLQKSQQKIFKRFFKQRKNQFQQENFIMHQLNYSIQWTRDYQVQRNTYHQMSEQEYQSQVKKNQKSIKQEQEEPQMQYNQYLQQNVYSQPTIAIYPSRQSYTLRELQFDPQQAKMIFFKLVKQLKKTHSNGIIHNDLKMGNILINSVGPNFKMFETQLIDWNLASFYYLGYQSSMKKGTVCYYAPQLLLKTYHITPAIDVWSLGVVLFIYFTNRKPFFYKCKVDNLKAIVSLVGGKRIIQLIQKYGYNYQPANMELIDQILQYPQKFPQMSIRDAIPDQRKEFFTDQLVNIFERMLEPDPEKRISITQLLQSNYFKSLKKLPKMGQMKKLQQQKKNKKEPIIKNQIQKQQNKNQLPKISIREAEDNYNQNKDDKKTIDNAIEKINNGQESKNNDKVSNLIPSKNSKNTQLNTIQHAQKNKEQIIKQQQTL